MNCYDHGILCVVQAHTIARNNYTREHLGLFLRRKHTASMEDDAYFSTPFYMLMLPLLYRLDWMHGSWNESGLTALKILIPEVVS